jgi:hypothetical protein
MARSKTLPHHLVYILFAPAEIPQCSDGAHVQVVRVVPNPNGNRVNWDPEYSYHYDSWLAILTSLEAAGPDAAGRRFAPGTLQVRAKKTSTVHFSELE